MVVFETWEEVIASGKTYDLLYADPPWRYERDTAGLTGCASNRPDGKGYLTMPDEDIKNMGVDRIANKHSFLCMWATGARMDSAIDIMRAWGFTYTTMLFVWQKQSKDKSTRMIMGNYTRSSTEFILLGKKGNGIKIPVVDKIKNMHQVVRHEIIGHSVKPPEFVALIQKLFKNPEQKIELFARVGFEGWDLFGNEAKYSSVPLTLQSKLR